MTGWYQVLSQSGNIVMTFVGRWEAENYAAELNEVNKQYNRTFTVRQI